MRSPGRSHGHGDRLPAALLPHAALPAPGAAAALLQAARLRPAAGHAAAHLRRQAHEEGCQQENHRLQPLCHQVSGGRYMNHPVLFKNRVFSPLPDIWDCGFQSSQSSLEYREVCCCVFNQITNAWEFGVLWVKRGGGALARKLCVLCILCEYPPLCSDLKFQVGVQLNILCNVFSLFIKN